MLLLCVFLCCAAQNSVWLDSLFTGKFLGHKSDIADGSLRGWEFRTYNNLQGDYYIAPRFLERVALHLAKNQLKEQGAFDSHTNVPLILGIWGKKGCGKTFQTELCFKKLGVEPVIMSAGKRGGVMDGRLIAHGIKPGKRYNL